MENKEYASSQSYFSSIVRLEYISVKNYGCYHPLSKKETQYLSLNLSNDIEYHFRQNRSMNNWDETYYKDFIKFTSLQSKNFKKKLIKVVYIFENEKSDIKYRKIFNFLVNYFNINIKKRVNNYDNKKGKLIDDTKIKYYNNIYYLTDFEKKLKPRENRNRNINKILKG